MKIFAAIYIILHFVACLSGSYLLWGADSWSYYSFPIGISLTAAALILIFVPCGNKCCDAIERGIKYIDRIPAYLWIFPAAFLFYMFAQETYFLGDGYLRLRNAEGGLLFSPAEPLDAYLHGAAHKLFEGWFGFTAADTYKWISIGAGMITISAMIYYLRKLFANTSERMIFALLILSMGTVQFYFGYAESYVLAFSVLLIYLLAAVNMLRQSEYSIIPAVYIGTAFILHPVALLFVPSAVYVYFKSATSQKQNLSQIIMKMLYPAAVFILICLFLIVLYAVSGYNWDDYLGTFGRRSHILPLFSQNDVYGILSLYHLVDVINIYLLAAPAVVVLPWMLKKFDIKKTGAEYVFLLIAFFFPFIFSLTFLPDLGYSRDWDILSVAAFPLVVFIGLVILSKLGSKSHKEAVRIVLAISIIHTIPWIIINSDEDLSLSRAERLAETPYWQNHSRAALYDELTQYYVSGKNMKKSLEYIEKAYRFSKNERYLYSLAMLNMNNGRIQQAKSNFEELSATGYKRFEVNSVLGGLYFNDHDYQNAKKCYETALLAKPNDINTLNVLGQISMINNDPATASDYFKAIIRLDPNNTMVLTSLAGIYEKLRSLDDAVAVYRKILVLKPKDKYIHYSLALIYADKGLKDKSLHHLRKAEQYGMNKDRIQEIRRKLEN